jgi:phenylalanine ammonia-lyase
VLLLQRDVVPIVPLRGSISASGDLSPLAYLAGAVQGNPGIWVWGRDEKQNERKLLRADVALREANIEPIRFAPKEALALVNGTSFSAGVAALAMQDKHHLVVLAQILTTMAVEGVNGTAETFDPYVAAVRPHPGQMEVARKINHFLKELKDSRLTRPGNSPHYSGLQQDRYALRTVSQWMGPELETLLVAHRQVVTECNSITDNPLVEPGGRILHGGNFRAISIRAAMDRSRAALQTIGRMLFQQLTEPMNQATNNGLPLSLTADEPSCDFLMKGMDMAAAVYQSELAFLSHSVTPFVMVAEQGNQSLNSLALISAPYTHTAVNIAMKMYANSLVALCQALDLRALQYRFFATFNPIFECKSLLWMESWLDQKNQYRWENLRVGLWSRFVSEFARLSSMDLVPRFKAVMATLRASITDEILDASKDAHLPTADVHHEVKQWAQDTANEAHDVFRQLLNAQSPSHTASLLGVGSRRVYRYIREDLQVPLIQGEKSATFTMPVFKGAKPGVTLGTYTSRVYHALRQGLLLRPVMESLREAIVAELDAGRRGTVEMAQSKI